MRHLIAAGAFALGTLILVPHAALAQNGEAPRTAEQLVIDVARSDRMADEAFRMEADNQNWTKAARRYVESAELRPYGDVKAYMALHRAGLLFDFADKRRDARRAFAAAGVRALETGHVYEAALAFANAAELAQRDPGHRGGQQALNYGRMAHRLSEAPSLSTEQRKDLQRRLGITGS